MFYIRRWVLEGDFCTGGAFRVPIKKQGENGFFVDSYELKYLFDLKMGARVGCCLDSCPSFSILVLIY